jgi:hypothetical protein
MIENSVPTRLLELSLVYLGPTRPLMSVGKLLSMYGLGNPVTRNDEQGELQIG